MSRFRSQFPNVTAAEITMAESGLTPAVLPSYSPEQLSKMQCGDPVLGELWRRWHARWEPGQSTLTDGVPGLQAWISEWPRLVEKIGVIYRVVQDGVLYSCPRWCPL